MLFRSGIFKYCHKYVPQLAKFIIPLHNIIADANKRKIKDICWTEDTLNTFQEVKNKFAKKNFIKPF